MYKTFGKVIKQLRENRGWTLDDLAGQIGELRGADRSGIQRIESGKKKAPLELYAALAAAFDMRLSMLIAATEQELGMPGNTLTDEERKLIADFRTMLPEQKASFRELARAIAANR